MKRKKSIDFEIELAARKDVSSQLFSKWCAMLRTEKRVSIITGNTVAEVEEKYAEEMRKLQLLRNGKGRLNSLLCRSDPEWRIDAHGNIVIVIFYELLVLRPGYTVEEYEAAVRKYDDHQAESHRLGYYI